MTEPVYWDPYDFAITADPYPVFARLREQAPIYYNEKHDFYTLSRFDDVERALIDHETYISGRGAILEMIKANVAVPRGLFLFEDPPVHTVHRSLLKRAFTPHKMKALELQLRDFCASCLDPLVGRGGFDFVADLGAQVPMRVIGMLLGIPEDDQQRVRRRTDAKLRRLMHRTTLRGTEEIRGVAWKIG
jgi:cytochrome P450